MVEQRFQLQFAQQVAMPGFGRDVPGAAAEQGRAQHGCRRRVGDAHLADRQQVAIVGYGAISGVAASRNSSALIAAASVKSSISHPSRRCAS
jgi:hypothetical protein